MSRCWICEGPVVRCELFAPEPFVRCERCSFVFRPDLDAPALEAVYAGGAYEDVRGEHYLAELSDRRRDARVRLDYLQAWKEGAGPLFDIGAAGGAFVAEALARGFEAAGVEPVPSFARAARERLGLEVHEGAIQEIDLPPDRYEAITLWHVLEHIPHPLAQLRRIADALRPGGIVAIEVPNAASAVASRMGSTWPSLEPRVHVNQFAPESLRELLERSELELCDLSTTAISPYLRRRARLGPRHLAARAKAALWLRDPRPEHPRGHELLRAVARRP